MKTKIILYLFILGCTSCMVDLGPKPYYYGYEETPYEVHASWCYEDYWGYECCDWVVEDFYEECIETWCYDEYWEEWEYYEESQCYPI